MPESCKLDGHGFEKAVFVKISRGQRQTAKIMQDGCVIYVLERLADAGVSHTLKDMCDSPEIRQQLINSRFEEEI